MMKRRGRALSIRQFSRKLGYASDRTIGMVVQGQRDLSPELIRRLVKYAQLSLRDKEFLSLLALRQRLHKAGKPTKEVEAQIQSFRGKETKSRPVRPLHLEKIAKWYAFPLVEILRQFQEPLHIEEISKRLRGAVPFGELKETLKSLNELGFIKQDAKGWFRNLAENEYITTPVDIPSATVRALHKEQLKRAMETLEEQSVTEREFIANTLTVSSSKIPLLKKRIREVMDELSDEFVATDSEDAVATQINIQLYQQSKS